MAKIHTPVAGYTGPGPGGVHFEDGVAESDDPAVIGYCQAAGYKVSGKVLNSVEPAEVPDPREQSEVVVGTRLRDAAVDPRPEDFLAPINAGQANPHGPEVVSPEIHASGPAGVRPGDVIVEDPAKQESREKEYAEARLIQQAPAGEAVAAEVNLDDRGPLGISDPGSAEQGRRDAGGDAVGGAPTKSENKAAWVAYAVSQGADEDEAGNLTKAELVEQYGS